MKGNARGRVRHCPQEHLPQIINKTCENENQISIPKVLNKVKMLICALLKKVEEVLCMTEWILEGCGSLR
jgi:hypothetical protein